MKQFSSLKDSCCSFKFAYKYDFDGKEKYFYDDTKYSFEDIVNSGKYIGYREDLKMSTVDGSILKADKVRNGAVLPSVIGIMADVILIVVLSFNLL